MNLRRTKTQATVAGTVFYALPSDFMLERGILSCAFKALPCTIIRDLRLLDGYKNNLLLAPTLLEGPIAWVGEQTVSTVLTWCINIDPAPDDTGPLVYIYRAIPAVMVTDTPDVDSQLPTSCDEPASLYAAMKLKMGRDDADGSSLLRLYKASLTRIGASTEGL
jgi:hypothetical protein